MNYSTHSIILKVKNKLFSKMLIEEKYFILIKILTLKTNYAENFIYKFSFLT